MCVSWLDVDKRVDNARLGGLSYYIVFIWSSENDNYVLIDVLCMGHLGGKVDLSVSEMGHTHTVTKINFFLIVELNSH